LIDFDCAAVPGSTTSTSGWMPRAMRVQAGHRPQASTGRAGTPD
jgi:hypothetical protein